MAISDILLAPASIWYAPVGEDLPADSVIKGADWGGNWESLGYTLTPLTINYSRETHKVYVEQVTAPVKEKKTTEELTAETTLAEFTGPNLELVFGGEATDTPAGDSQVGKTEHKMGGDTDIPVFAFGFEGAYEDANGAVFPVRILIHRGKPVLGGELQFAKAAPTGLPLRVEAEADTTQAAGEQLMLIQKVTAAATGS
jgi:hypothetical protein